MQMSPRREYSSLSALVEKLQSQGTYTCTKAYALDRLGGTARALDARRLHKYLPRSGVQVSRAQFEENIALKVADRKFTADRGPLLAEGKTFSPADDCATAHDALIAHLPGQPWKGLPAT